jgi:hypothetical protein
MIRYIKEEINVPKIMVCDVCKKEYDCKEDILEVQEFLSVDNYCGFNSVFGDGNTVKADICQHCVKELLGNYLRIEEQK